MDDLRSAITEIKSMLNKGPLPKASVVRRRLSLLNHGAEPGPSGQRNSHLARLRQVPDGIQALRTWAGMWNQGKVLASTSLLWTAGIFTPIDCGEKPETRTGRKLRPITLTENLIKFTDSVGIDEHVAEVKRVFEPGQLGICTPDGNIILLRALQSWSEHIESSNKNRLTVGCLMTLRLFSALTSSTLMGSTSAHQQSGL